MNIFKDLKIRTKLLLSFSIIVIIICAVGFVGLESTKKINENGKKCMSIICIVYRNYI